MKPAARYEAASVLLDDIVAGAPAERVLTSWGRRSRFAGSRDRLAVRDLVFDALRCRRSFGWLGGGDAGRALMLGHAKAGGVPLEAVFSGDKYAMSRLSDDELATPASLDGAPPAVRCDVPDWTVPHFDTALGQDADAVMASLRERAPVTLRANLAKISRDALIARLVEDGYEASAHPLAATAIRIDGAPRSLTRHAAFEDGSFDFQDAASQAAVLTFADHARGAHVLDYCAGGGGKSLAVAALGAAEVVAHDANAKRMVDLPERARRAGAAITTVASPSGQFDVVMCDVPCSGSGAWRRQPEAKWRLTQLGLDNLCKTQRQIVSDALPFVRTGGHLVYMTCSLFNAENGAQTQETLAKHLHLSLVSERSFTPLDGGDGFYVVVFSVGADSR